MARKPPSPDSLPSRRMRGFEPAAGLLSRRIQAAGESRGFAVAKLLTHWSDIAGPDLAPVTRPVKVGYGREGLGATLTVLVAPAHAPLVEMRKERLRERVNSVYGYNAIARIVLTQTAATGFSEGQADFGHAPRKDRTNELPTPSPQAQAVAEGVSDDGLRRALAQLAENVLSRTKATKGTPV